MACSKFRPHPPPRVLFEEKMGVSGGVLRSSIESTPSVHSEAAEKEGEEVTPQA